jgi:Ankyrin repeats (3 copies)
VRLLVERGAEVDSRDKWGWTPLYGCGHLEVSRMLIDHGANVNTRQLDGWTPLGVSVIMGQLEIVELLLEHGADVLAPNSAGQTPYQLSLQNGYRGIANLLREHGAGRARFEEILLWLMQYLTGTSILALSYRIVSICRLGYYAGNNSETGSRKSVIRTGLRVRLPGPGPQDSGPSGSRLFLSERRWFNVGRFLLFNVQRSTVKDILSVSKLC